MNSPFCLSLSRLEPGWSSQLRRHLPSDLFDQIRAPPTSGERVEMAAPWRLHPDFCRTLSALKELKEQREDERLRHAHDREFVISVPDTNTLPRVATTQTPNKLLGDALQGRIDPRVPSSVLSLKRSYASVTIAVTLSGFRKSPGRYKGFVVLWMDRHFSPPSPIGAQRAAVPFMK